MGEPLRAECLNTPPSQVPGGENVLVHAVRRTPRGQPWEAFGWVDEQGKRRISCVLYGSPGARSSQRAIDMRIQPTGGPGSCAVAGEALDILP